jgi:hypothetical protein
MKKLSFLITTILLLISSSFGQEYRCPATSSSVVIRGFRLGMTETEVKRRYPKIQIFKDLDNNGLTLINIDGSSYDYEEVFTESERKGLRFVSIKFLDKKIVRIGIDYDGFTEWNSTKEFTDAISKNLRLPLADKWQKLNEKSFQLSCGDFFIISKLEPKSGTGSLQKPSLLLSINDFDKIIKEGVEDRKERQRKTFKP